jgi:hypothetical protein
VRRSPQLRLYVEGGGDSDALHTELRQAVTALLRDAGVTRLPRIVACGGRGAALDDFRNAVEKRGGSERAFLLIDSESPVAEGNSVWDHLRKSDTWEKPPAAEQNSVFLMIQCMETWLLADVDTLEAYFRPAFNRKALTQWPDLEAVPKTTILETLRAATRTGKAYAKGKISFELLARVKAARIEAACPAATVFFDAMRAL